MCWVVNYFSPLLKHILYWIVYFCTASLGNSISKVREKRLTPKSGFFLWNVKDNRQIDDFGCFLNHFYNFGCFFKPKIKIPKNDCYEKGKIKQKCFFKDWTTYCKYHIYHSYSMSFMVLLICFVICNILGQFLPF